jgi:cytochrome c6
MSPKRARTAALLTIPVCLLTACSPEQPKARPEAPKAAAPQPSLSGEELFRQFCSTCHPDGGNVSDPERNLRGTALRTHNITTPEDIVRVVRQPRSRMISFDRATLPDPEARAIADYILRTFK